MIAAASSSESQFQSTLLMRGATSDTRLAQDLLRTFQSTLLMRGATTGAAGVAASFVFQSTLLMRGATPSSGLCSIHSYFNPRSSCEERRAGRSGRGGV